MRDGKKKDVKATLATQKNSFARSYSYTMPDGAMKQFSMPRIPSTPRVYGNGGNYNFDGMVRRQKLGLKIQDTEDNTGVKVLDVEAASAAATSGLMKDDIITEIGGEKVSNTDEAREQLQEKCGERFLCRKSKKKRNRNDLHREDP